MISVGPLGPNRPGPSAQSAHSRAVQTRPRPVQPRPTIASARRPDSKPSGCRRIRANAPAVTSRPGKTTACARTSIAVSGRNTAAASGASARIGENGRNMRQRGGQTNAESPNCSTQRPPLRASSRRRLRAADQPSSAGNTAHSAKPRQNVPAANHNQVGRSCRNRCANRANAASTRNRNPPVNIR